MYVPCILSGTAVSTWFKTMRTLFGRMKKKTKSGQAAKPNTARQLWTLQNFQFLEAHLAIWTETRELGRVLVPVLPMDLEEEEQLQPAAQYTAAQHVLCQPQSTTM